MKSNKYIYNVSSKFSKKDYNLLKSLVESLGHKKFFIGFVEFDFFINDYSNETKRKITDCFAYVFNKKTKSIFSLVEIKFEGIDENGNPKDIGDLKDYAYNITEAWTSSVSGFAQKKLIKLYKEELLKTRIKNLI